MNINNKEYTDNILFDAVVRKVESIDIKAKALLSANLELSVLGYEAEYSVNAQTQANLASVVASGESSKWTCYVGGVKTRVLHTHEQLKAINLAGKHRYDEVKEWEENTINAIMACETLAKLEAVEL